MRQYFTNFKQILYRVLTQFVLFLGPAYRQKTGTQFLT